MNTKLHSKLKRTLAWIMAVTMMVQGVSVVSADDFSSELDMAVVSEETVDFDSEADAPDVTDDESTQDVDSDVTIDEETEDEQLLPQTKQRCFRTAQTMHFFPIVPKQ